MTEAERLSFDVEFAKTCMVFEKNAAELEPIYWEQLQNHGVVGVIMALRKVTGQTGRAFMPRPGEVIAAIPAGAHALLLEHIEVSADADAAERARALVVDLASKLGTTKRKKEEFVPTMSSRDVARRRRQLLAQVPEAIERGLLSKEGLPRDDGEANTTDDEVSSMGGEE